MSRKPDPGSLQTLEVDQASPGPLCGSNPNSASNLIRSNIQRIF